MPSRTHEVVNQPPPLVDYDLFTTDPALQQAVERECAAWAVPRLTEFGRALGTEDLIRCGFQANDYPPVLETHDRFGHRRDEVEFHPAWHELMKLSIANGVHSLPWAEPRQGAHVARAALMILAGENEAGHMCPVSMTYSSIPVLRLAPALARDWEPKVLSTEYDPRFRPHTSKTGALIGMGMTEKQGGSDVRANTTRAEPASGAEYRITGHKFFCSAPMCDAFLVLAQAPGGLTCFFLPRWTPDGERNGFAIQRLKRKLGNRSNASSEVEFENAWAHRIGDEGRGVATIMDMVQHTRLDCCLGSAAIMRRALVEAVHHARYRSAFGRLLSDQPLMRAVLSDLAIESEATTLMVMRLARAFDRRAFHQSAHNGLAQRGQVRRVLPSVEAAPRGLCAEDAHEHAFARLATAVSKYWISKRAAAFVGEALECLGGSGYVEESILPRLFREAPLNSIWEGSGNVVCLDVLRAFRKEPESIEAYLAEVRLAKGGNRFVDDALAHMESALARRPDEAGVRRLAESMAVLLGASLAVRHSPTAVSDALCTSRLGGDWGRTFGTLGPADAAAILERAYPGA